MNINIFLRQFKMNNSDIVKLVADGNHEAIGPEKIAGLIKILPEPEDVGDHAVEIMLTKQRFNHRYKNCFLSMGMGSTLCAAAAQHQISKQTFYKWS